MQPPRRDPKPTVPRIERRSPWPWLLIALFVFTAFLNRAPISGDHERRVAETAANMARSGWPWSARAITPTTAPNLNGAPGLNPWLVPVFEDHIRLQKPPLPYWTTAIAYRLFGEGPGIARAPTALLGVGAAWLIYLLARRVSGRRVAVVSMAAWVSTYFVVSEYRKSMADPYLGFFVLAAIVAWVEACFVLRRRAALVVLFYACVALACLAKGPVAFLHLALSLGAFTLCYRRLPKVNVGWHLLGAALWLLITLPWPAYVTMRVPGAIEIWRFESVGEFADNTRNARPFWFYLPAPLQLSAPWTFAWAVAVFLAFARRSRRRYDWPLLWLAATVLVFSFVHMKKNAYLVPIAPAMVLSAAQAAVRGIAFARRRLRPDQVRLLALVHTIVGIAFAVIIAVLSIRTRPPGAGVWAAIVAASVAAVLVRVTPHRVAAFGSTAGRSDRADSANLRELALRTGLCLRRSDLPVYRVPADAKTIAYGLRAGTGIPARVRDPLRLNSCPPG